MNKKTFDWNTILGFLLIGAIFVYFGYINQPSETLEGEQPVETTVDSAEVVEETEDLTREMAPRLDSSALQAGGLLASTQGQAQTVKLENEVLEVEISTLGGQIVMARLKDFQTYDSLPLYMIKDNTSFNIVLSDEREFNTADLYWEVEEQSSNEVVMLLNAGGGKSLRYTYKIEPENYMLDWDIRSDGLDDMIGADAGMQWEMKTRRSEKNRERENSLTRVEYRLMEDDDVDDLSVTGSDEEVVQDIRWVAFAQQFFSSVLLNREGEFERVAVMSSEFEEGVDPGFTKLMAAKVALADKEDIDANLGLYLGPNKYDILKAYNEDLDELIPLGWGILGWINKGVVINIFNWLENYGLNYGMIILIMAVLIKLVLFPLTYSSYRSMAKMRVLKPEIDEIAEKYKDKDPMKKQQATMELYSKAGVSPLGGCIPVLFQMPILFALFKFFPASIELRQESFLWAEDLSTYDSIAQLPFTIPFYGDHVSLFTLLMTVSTLIYTYMNQQLTGSNQQYPQLKYMMYLMPIVFLGALNSYPAALSYYYFVANVITFSQQFAIRSFVDDEKIHAKLQEKKKQPGKENRLMRRMRELQDDQNRQARRKK